MLSGDQSVLSENQLVLSGDQSVLSMAPWNIGTCLLYPSYYFLVVLLSHTQTDTTHIFVGRVII